MTFAPVCTPDFGQNLQISQKNCVDGHRLQCDSIQSEDLKHVGYFELTVEHTLIVATDSMRSTVV